MALPTFRVAYTLHGGPPAREAYESGGAITAGNLVRLAAGDGQIDEIGAGDDVTNILGIAANAATGAGETVVVYLATLETIFSGAIAAGTYVQADVGDLRSIDTDGIDCDTAGNSAVRIKGEDGTEASATRVLFQFMESDSQAADVASV